MNGMSRRRAVVAGDWLCELTASRGMFSSQFTVALTVSFIIPRGLRLGGHRKQIWHNLHINVRIQLEETRQKSEAKPFSWQLLCYDLTSQHPVMFCWSEGNALPPLTVALAHSCWDLRHLHQPMLAHCSLVWLTPGPLNIPTFQTMSATWWNENNNNVPAPLPGGQTSLNACQFNPEYWMYQRVEYYKTHVDCSAKFSTLTSMQVCQKPLKISSPADTVLCNSSIISLLKCVP